MNSTLVMCLKRESSAADCASNVLMGGHDFLNHYFFLWEPDSDSNPDVGFRTCLSPGPGVHPFPRDVSFFFRHVLRQPAAGVSLSRHRKETSATNLMPEVKL